MKLSLEPTNSSPYPPSAARLASLVSNEDTEINDLVECISFDQGLTLKLLKAANCAARASARKITQVRDAVVRLGRGSVLSIAIGSSVKKRLEKPIPEYGLCEGELWRHSAAASIAAELLNSAVSCDVPPAAYTAGLLHNVGKLVMCRYLDPKTQSYLSQAVASGLTKTQAEIEVLGVHYGEVGGVVAQHWKLPDSITQGIIYHVDPDQVEEIGSDVVHVASHIALKTSNTDTQHLPLAPKVLARLALGADELEQLTHKAESRLDTLMARYSA